MIIKIFENGRVEYQRIHNGLLGKHEYQMDKPTLKKLIKKFEEANFMEKAIRQREILPYLLISFCPETETGILYRKDFQEATKFEDYEMEKEIIRATNAKQWGVDKIEHFSCDK